MALLGFGVVTLAFFVLLGVGAGKWVGTGGDDRVWAAYSTVWTLAFRAWVIYGLWVFGLRIDHLTAAVSYLIDGVTTFL